MKVVAIDVHRLAVPLRRPIRTAVHHHEYANTVLVEMRTDAGLVGTGWCFAFGDKRAMALAALVESLVPIYEGRDPRAVRARHTDAWRELNFLGHAGAPLMALSALDTACWDIAAQAASLPLFRFLGGETSRVATYASSGLWLDYTEDALTAEAQRFLAEGHRAMKMRVGRKDSREDLARARLVREAVGPEVALLVDANQGWDEATAIRVGRELQAQGIYWLEEPLFYQDVAGCARVAAALDMRVATGETAYGPAAMKDHLEARAADILMPDLQRMGGITGYLQAAELCRAWHQPVSSHLFTEASAHVLASQPHATMLEHMDWWNVLFTEPLIVMDGAVVLAERPGLGLTIAAGVLQRFAA